MDIRQIEFFVALAEELNFTRAAEVTNVSQPGLSSSIRSLERELRRELFDRSPRSVALTNAGFAFLPRARRILADAQAAQRELAEDVPAIAGTLAVGAEQCLGDTVDLPDLLAAFRHRYPGVSMRFEQLGADEVLSRILRADLDAGLVALPGDVPSHGAALESLEITRDGFELLAAPEHPLATCELSWQVLEEHPFVDLGPAWSARQIVDAAFTRRRLARQTAFAVNDIHMLFELVSCGLGVALVPTPYAAKPQAADLVRRPLGDADLTWVVWFLAASDAGRLPRLFADLLLTAEAVAGIRSTLGGEQRAAGG